MVVGRRVSPQVLVVCLGAIKELSKASNLFEVCRKKLDGETIADARAFLPLMQSLLFGELGHSPQSQVRPTAGADHIVTDLQPHVLWVVVVVVMGHA